MTMSSEHKRKKAEAMRESKDHLHNANVNGMRSGQDHESHKDHDMAADDMARKPNGMTNSY